MNRSSLVRAALALLLLAGAAVPAGAADAQRDRLIGSFWLRLAADSVTGQDHSLVMVLPDSQFGAGALLWACAGDGFVSGLRLPWSRRDGRPRAVVARFDGQAPDTMVLAGVRDVGVWFLDARNGERFTRRVQASQRLVLTVAPDSSGGRPYDFTYGLGGARSALDGLDCDADGRGRSAGLATLRRAHETPWLDTDGRLSDAASEQLPQLLNADEIRRQLAWSYPTGLRDAGVEAQVVVTHRVLENGRVDPASLRVTSTTNAQFDSAALAAAARGVFRPAHVYNRPVKVWVSQPFHFTLANYFLPADSAAAGRGRRPRRGAPARPGPFAARRSLRRVRQGSGCRCGTNQGGA